MLLKNFSSNRVIAEVALPLPMDATFYYVYPGEFAEGNAVGCKVKVQFGNKSRTGIIVRLKKENEISGELPKQIKSIETVYFGQDSLSVEMIELARWMADYYCCSIGEALGCMFPIKMYSRKPQIKSKNAITPEKRNVELTADQLEACDKISESMAAGRSETFLLYGVTGSGKTEIYLKILKQAVDSGGSGIFLLPEISLTPQFVKRCSECFPDTVCLWHSRLSESDKHKAWQELSRGDKKIVLGVRSAIFAPLKNIKVIIIDEEQEDTYKQDKKPMYHAREIAVKRAQYHKAAVVLGSATPDMTSYHRALNSQYRLLTLKNRFLNVPMPEIELVDLKQGGIGRVQSIISSRLEFEINKCLARREQVILFLNRRGFAPNCMCSKCGWTAKCPLCSLSLVRHESWSKKCRSYHQPGSDAGEKQLFWHRTKSEDDTGFLSCHFCGHRSQPPKKCPECGNTDMVYFGIGTQKLEKELRRLFPEARMCRMDYDTTRGRDIHEKIYNDFLGEKFDILFGTQMIGKGFDFPRVTLVGIIDADVIMHMPDFRAAEKTFRMIIQVAGRAGRKTLLGKVLVQTYYPEHFVLKMAQKHDYEDFYREDIASREMFNYPPFSDLIDIVMHGKKEEEVSKNIEALAGEIRSFIDRNGLKDTLSGPSPALRPFLRGYFRYQMIIKTKNENKILWSNFFKSTKIKSNLRLTIDIDPQSLF